MSPRIVLSAALSVLALAACATAPATPSNIPSDREVVAYVGDNWDSYQSGLAYLADRRGQSPVLVSVKEVDCRAFGTDAACTLVVTGRFADGAVVSRPMDSHFRRMDDGSIEQLIPVAR